MKVIRGEPAGKPHKITCTGCGKKAFEAGIAVSETAAEEGKGYGPDGPILMIDEDDAHPLCEECVTALLRKEEGAAAERKTE